MSADSENLDGETRPVGSDSSDDCVHHWIIESASGPTSIGVCSYCGATRDFRNSLDGESRLQRHNPGAENARQTPAA
jgi:hypothetical protein